MADYLDNQLPTLGKLELEFSNFLMVFVDWTQINFITTKNMPVTKSIWHVEVQSELEAAFEYFLATY